MATSIPFASALAVVLDLTLLISVAPSQCTTDWSTGGNAGVGGPLTAVAPLADGGIAGAALLSVASGATQVLRFDGTTWQPLGGTTNGQVKALVALPNGDLVAGGRFTAIGPVSAIALARWDGQAFVTDPAGKKCPSSLQGATYATSQVDLLDDRMVSWDRGFDDTGKQVWGATKGGYEFIRRSPKP